MVCEHEYVNMSPPPFPPMGVSIWSGERVKERIIKKERVIFPAGNVPGSLVKVAFKVGEI